MDNNLTKPLQAKELIAMIERVLRSGGESAGEATRGYWRTEGDG
jgi:DNA-binding response OmpR family regulator